MVQKVSYFDFIQNNSHYKEFVSLLNNNDQKNQNENGNGKSKILLEASLDSAHSVGMYTGIIKVLQKKNLKCDVLMRRKDAFHMNRVFKKLNTKMIYFENRYKPNFKALLLTLFFFVKSLFTVNRFLKIKFKSILIGDLIYDTILKRNRQIYTVKLIIHFKYIFITVRQFLFIFREIEDLFSRSDYDLIIVTDKYYIYNGIITRLALKKSIKVVEIKNTRFNVLNENNYLINDYNDNLEVALKNVNDMEEVDKYLDSRFSGVGIEHHDVIAAFQNKKQLTRDEYFNLLGIHDDSRLKILIAPHAFSDVPHCEPSMAFTDYYQAFLHFLKLAKKIKHIDWIVRAHPSSYMYAEEGVVEKDALNLTVCPKSVSSRDAVNYCDAVLTVRGTIGAEAIIFGKPSFICGDAVYEHLPPVHKFCNKKELGKYFSNLKEKKDLPLVESVDIESAKKCVYWWHALSLSEIETLPPQRFPGMNIESICDYENKGYAMICKNIKAGEFYTPFVEKVDSMLNELL